MSKAIPKTGKTGRDRIDAYDDLCIVLRDIYTVADLLSEVCSDHIGPEQVNATGYCLTRMITVAQTLSEEACHD